MAGDGKKSFGLLLRKSTGKATLDSMAKANRPSVFGDDDDDGKVDTNMMARVKLSASESRVKKQAEREHDRALAEDPMIFDYDAKYEEDQAKKNEKLSEQTAADKERKPKYVPALLKAHKRRELEMQSREERKQQKERVIEGEQFADKETFVTGAYKSQMEEMEKYREEEAKEDRLQALMDVTKQKDYRAGFYRNLLNDLARDGSAPSTTAEVKKEPTDDAKNDDKSREKEKVNERATTSEQSAAAKAKSYRRRRHSSSSSDEDASKTFKQRRKGDKPNKSIYSDDSDAEPDSSHPPQKAPKKGGLDIVRSSVTAAPSKGRSGVTKIEQQRRFFTPSPPSTPEPKRDDDRGGRRREDDKNVQSKQSKRGRSRSPRRSSPKERGERKSTADRTSSKDQKENESDTPIEKKPVVKAEPPRSRLDRLKDTFKRKNTEAEIDGYRQRYFERKASGLTVGVM